MTQTSLRQAFMPVEISKQSPIDIRLIKEAAHLSQIGASK